MRVLIIDEPWSHTPWLVQACRDRGMTVEVAVPRAGMARCRTLGVRAHVLPDDELQQRDAIARLLADGASPASTWDRIVPVSERLLLLCAEIAPAALAATLPVARQDLHLLADRRRMLDFVAGLGIAVPPQAELPEPARIDDAALRLGWPLVLRGIQGTGSSQVRIARDAVTARADWQCLHGDAGAPVFAQRFVPGTIVIVGGIFVDGHIVRAVCSEPVERWPEPTSPSIVQRTFRDARLEELCRRLMAALRYNGLGCIEWMRCSDGSHVFIELNPRSWASMACTRPLGIDFAAQYAGMLAGTTSPAPADPFDIPAGVRLPLFPRYLAAGIAGDGIATLLRNPRLCWRALRAAPWRRPRLLLALARQIAGAFRARRHGVRA